MQGMSLPQMPDPANIMGKGPTQGDMPGTGAGLPTPPMLPSNPGAAGMIGKVTGPVKALPEPIRNPTSAMQGIK